MPPSAALRRLLRVRSLEEEQHRLALESALADLHSLKRVLALARATERRGRAHLRSSARAVDPAERIAAQVEILCAARHAAALLPRITAAEVEASRLQRLFLSKRTERRQVEVLIADRETREALVAAHREQQTLDNWFSSRGKQEKTPLQSRTTRSRQKDP